MRTLRLSAKGGLYNPSQIRSIDCMLANVYSGSGSYKRIYIFNKYNPIPKKNISEFKKMIDFVSKVTFP